MPRVAISSSSPLATEAGAEIARAGGNAVDAAIAASVVSAISEPGMVALGAGGYITIWPGQGDPLSLDGGVEMPGRGQPEEAFGGGGVRVHLDYLGGVEAIVGAASVGTPGAVAAWGEASARFGHLPWRELFGPALAVARDGFPMPPTSYGYLSAAHQKIFGRDSDSFAALHDAEGRLLKVGETIRMPGLESSLELLAREGSDAFYRGDLADAIARSVAQGDGLLNRRDLEAYRVRVQPPVRFAYGPWQAATAAPSSIGGALLAAMMKLALPLAGSDPGSAQWQSSMIAIQNTVYGLRAAELDGNPQFEQAALDMLARIDAGGVVPAQGSASTVHTSTADSDGLACSVTISAGYGSGLMPAGTGFWLNNCLGELELNCGGFHSLPPGTRLLSCMAPTVARHRDGQTLAIGSPGSARIVSAQFQALVNAWYLGLDWSEAISRPRLHAEPQDGEPRVWFEPGIELPESGLRQQRFDAPDTFFGGVGVALAAPGGPVDAATDARRSGTTAVV